MSRDVNAMSFIGVESGWRKLGELAFLIIYVSFNFPRPCISLFSLSRNYGI